MHINEDRLMTLEVDKLVCQHTLKIPEILRKGIDDLPPDIRKKMNIRIMVTMAQVLHEARFNPEEYLSTRDD